MNNSFQRFFWEIAGAEIPILEKCRTDHKKFSIIGGMILMTAFVALCAGTSAAWYFTQKGSDNTGEFEWALAFGCLWSLLIFCIDRSLVVTLKKDPTQEKQRFIIPLISRAILAIIVAFMVSIPLELVIFEDYISSKEEDFNAYQMSVLGEKLKENSGENTLTKQITNADNTLVKLGAESAQLGKEADNLQAQIDRLEIEKNTPNSSEYRSAKSRFDIANRKYNSAKANYNTEKRKQYPSQTSLNSYNSQITLHSREMTNAKRDMNIASQAWKNSKQKEIDKLLPQLQAKRLDKQSKDQAYNSTLSSQLNDKERAKKAAEVREMTEAKKQESINRGNHFIQHFQILEFAVWQRDKNGNLTETTQLMFLWLIRLLFFIIELLPTIVKIVSPIGAYEHMVYAEEESMKEYLKSSEFIDKIKNIHRLALSTQEDLQQIQHDSEIELKSQLMNSIKQAQLEIAELVIKNWKEKEIKNHKQITTNSSKILTDEEFDDEIITNSAI